LRYLLKNPFVAAANIRDQIQWPEAVSPRMLGAVFNLLGRDGVIRRSRIDVNIGENGHSQALDVWELTDPSLAVALLEKHALAAAVSIGRKPMGPIRSAPAATNIVTTIPTIEIDEVNNLIRYENCCYCVSKRAVKLFKAVQSARGEWVAINKKSISKPSDVTEKLPAPLATLLESRSGKGYRLRHLSL